MAANASRIPSNRKITLTGNDIDESTGTTRSVPTGIAGVQAQVPVQGEETGKVEFDIQPTLSESGSVSYFEIGDIRQAANMLIYMGTPSREFSINGRFVSRSKSEARKSWKSVQLLRSWRMPEQSGGGLNALKTPSRLTLRGFGNWFNSIKVRITSLTIEEPEDVDYIRTDNGHDVPIIWPVSVSLKEARSINELRQFDIDKFRRGELGGW